MNSAVENAKNNQACRNLCLVFGDQLTLEGELWQRFDPKQDQIWMAEVLAESQVVASSKIRTTLFFSAMRAFSEHLRCLNYAVDYHFISEKLSDFSAALQQAITKWHPQNIFAVLPGDNRVCELIEKTAQQSQVNLLWLPDCHFIAEPGEFKQWMSNKKQPRMEYWYRYLRKRHAILMDETQKPIGGGWNFDKQNRKSFNKTGPSQLEHPSPRMAFDAASRAIIEQVAMDIQHYLPNLPGQAFDFQSKKDFPWPINRQQALQALDHFIEHKLPLFGDYQDAMWMGEDTLFHSLIASSLNLKLLNPREVIKAAEQAFYQALAPINAVEGFIRQILGWREFVRGLYWYHRDQWLSFNALNAQQDLPNFYWHGQTQMLCLSESLRPVLTQGYGHHIQRLMVTGLFALLWQVHPKQIHEWYLAMYVDAVAWVEIPNTIGMGQYADGGIVGSKPYIASGAYINRMSNYCQNCRYQPTESAGEKACPFTSLYWAFIDAHRALLSQNPRLAMQVKHWSNKSSQEQYNIKNRVEWLFSHIEQL